MIIIAPARNQRRTWILVIIGLIGLLLGQTAVLASSVTSAQNPRTTSVQPSGNTAIKTVNVQVTDSTRPGDLAALSPEALATGDQPLHDFYFYIDPGHNSIGGPPDPAPESCRNRGTGPHWGVYEGDIAWNVANWLKIILISHGVPTSHIFMSRPTTITSVTIANRTDGTDPNQLCSTYGNNQAFMDSGSPTDKWRFISIHLNANGNGTERVEVFRKVIFSGEQQIPLANDFAENMSWQLNRSYPHPNPAYSGEWTRAYDPTACNPTPTPCDIYVVRFAKPRAWEDPDPTRNQPGSYNILAELGYLDNQSFNTWIVNTVNQQDEAEAIYRGFADFFVVGKRGSIQNKDQDIFDDYRLNITANRDPGPPLDNGGGYYVHQYGNALDQDFIRGGCSNGCRGSILKPLGGGAAHYVRDPLWATYIHKSGPNSNGLGLPIGEEHSWTASRKCGRCPTDSYDKVVNFERGAILWKSSEGGITPDFNQHGIFIPNCSASDINDPTYATYLRGMVGRFALGNDLETHLADPNNPTLPLVGLFTDAEIHPGANATRGQIALNLAWTEAFPSSTTNWGFTDTQNHWARPFISIMADRGIANGYNTNPPCTIAPYLCFLPSNSVARGQFAKMESLARGWSLVNPNTTHTSPACPNGYNSFSDVCYGSTFYQNIETVKAHNAIGGYDTYPPCDSTSPAPCFKPNNSVSRGQMAKIIDLALTNDGYPHQACWFSDMPMP